MDKKDIFLQYIMLSKTIILGYGLSDAMSEVLLAILLISCIISDFLGFEIESSLNKEKGTIVTSNFRSPCMPYHTYIIKQNH